MPVICGAARSARQRQKVPELTASPSKRAGMSDPNERREPPPAKGVRGFRAIVGVGVSVLMLQIWILIDMGGVRAEVASLKSEVGAEIAALKERVAFVENRLTAVELKLDSVESRLIAQTGIAAAAPADPD